VTRQRHLSTAGRLFISALSDTLHTPEIDDYNADSSEGVSPFQQNVSDGLRYTSSIGYLRTARPNLRAETGVTVRRVLISHGRATGVEVIDRSGVRVVHAAQEVVLCAGAIGSPQLLMLSGIGPADHLCDRDLDVTEHGRAKSARRSRSSGSAGYRAAATRRSARPCSARVRRCNRAPSRSVLAKSRSAQLSLSVNAAGQPDTNSAIMILA
jgi:choline dehydrogenase-like flavoprotein